MTTKPTAADVPREVWNVALEQLPKPRLAVDEVLAVPTDDIAWLVATDGKVAAFSQKHRISVDAPTRISRDVTVDEDRRFPSVSSSIPKSLEGRESFVVNPRLLTRAARAVTDDLDNGVLIVAPGDDGVICVLGSRGFGLVMNCADTPFPDGGERSAPALYDAMQRFLHDEAEASKPRPATIQGFLCS